MLVGHFSLQLPAHALNGCLIPTRLLGVLTNGYNTQNSTAYHECRSSVFVILKLVFKMCLASHLNCMWLCRQVTASLALNPVCSFHIETLRNVAGAVQDCTQPAPPADTLSTANSERLWACPPFQNTTYLNASLPFV